MPLIITDFIDPVELTGYVRARFADLAVNQFNLAQFLPNRTVDDLDFRISRRDGSGLIEVGAFRAYDTESPIVGRKGFSRISGELPPISVKRRLAEYDRLKLRKATGQQVRDAILGDVDQLVDAISSRMELARGATLLNAGLTLAENGLQLDVVWGRKPAHSVVAATLWSNVAADPLADLLAWQDVYVDSNGSEPGVILTSRKVVSTLIKNAAIRNIVFPGANQPSIVTQQAVRDALSAAGLPPILTYDVRVSLNGVSTRVLPDDRVFLLPATTGANNPSGTQLGGTFWGTTAESLEPEFGLTGNEPGLVAGTLSEKDPVALWTKAAAIGLPVLANPDLSFVADVL